MHTPADELRWIEGCLVDPAARRPGQAYARVQEVLAELGSLMAEHERLRRRMERIAAWADRYDGEIAGTMRDALDLTATGWWDQDDEGTGTAPPWTVRGYLGGTES